MYAFNIPGAETSALQHTVETRPKEVSAWLDRLPLASPVDTAQQLVMALYALNRRPLGEDERHTLQMLYRPVVERAAASLQTLLVDSAVPPLAQQRQTGTLLRELLSEFSIGYKHLLLALDKRRFGRNPPKRVAEICARLLAVLRDLQAAYYFTYTVLPAGLWLEMHQLFQLANSTELADTPIDDAPPASLPYRQALLLALADPPHMSHAELIHARLYLDKLGMLAALAPSPVLTSPGRFAIPTGSDRGAVQNPANPSEVGLWLDTDALCRQLHETTVRLRTGDSPRHLGLPQGMESTTSQAMGKQLLKLWRNGVQRAYKRHATPGSTMQVVAGVCAIHRLLELVPLAPEFETEPDGSLPIHDVEPLMFSAPVAVNATHWSVSNDSATGLALSGTPDAPLNLKVGDALAMRSDDAAMWSLGVIRWIRMRDARQVELGIERLSPQIQPVWVRPMRGQRKTSPEPGLFVPGLPALKQPDRLLLPRHLYQIGMDAEVWHAPRQYTLTFGRCHLHTAGFDLIDFTIFAEETRHD